MRRTDADRAIADRWYKIMEVGDVEAARLQIKKGIDLDPDCPKNKICKPLAMASDVADLEIMKLLLDAGADPNGPNAYGYLPLRYAYGSHIAGDLSTRNPRHRDAVILLIENGADVNKPDCFGTSPLTIFTGMGEIELIKKSLEYGADINGTYEAPCLDESYRETSFMHAVGGGHVEVVKLLIEHGADIDAIDAHGHNAIYFAKEKGHDEIVKLLSNK